MTDTETSDSGYELTSKPVLVAFIVRTGLGLAIAAWGWTAHESVVLVAVGLAVALFSELLRAGRWIRGRLDQ